MIEPDLLDLIDLLQGWRTDREQLRDLVNCIDFIVHGFDPEDMDELSTLLDCPPARQNIIDRVYKLAGVSPGEMSGGLDGDLTPSDAVEGRDLMSDFRLGDTTCSEMTFFAMLDRYILSMIMIVRGNLADKLTACFILPDTGRRVTLVCWDEEFVKVRYMIKNEGDLFSFGSAEVVFDFMEPYSPSARQLSEAADLMREDMKKSIARDEKRRHVPELRILKAWMKKNGEDRMRYVGMWRGETAFRVWRSTEKGHAHYVLVDTKGNLRSLAGKDDKLLKDGCLVKRFVDYLPETCLCCKKKTRPQRLVFGKLDHPELFRDRYDDLLFVDREPELDCDGLAWEPDAVCPSCGEQYWLRRE